MPDPSVPQCPQGIPNRLRKAATKLLLPGEQLIAHAYGTPKDLRGTHSRSSGWLVLTNVRVAFIPDRIFRRKAETLGLLDEIESIEVHRAWFRTSLEIHCAETDIRMGTSAASSETVESSFESMMRSAADDVFNSMREVVEKHVGALQRARRLKLRTDAYGVEERDQWDAELLRFVKRVAVPYIQSELGECRGTLGISSLTSSLSSITDSILEIYQSSETGKADTCFTPESLADPLLFEHACADALRQAGWEAEVMGGSGDQGVDVVAKSDKVTLVIQCKLYSKPLGNTAVQEVFAGKSHYAADFAAVATNADYTPGARDVATSTGVHLLHYSELAQLMPSDLMDQVHTS